MVRNKKSSHQYQSDLDILLQEYSNENLTIDIIKDSFNKNKRAKRFLDKHNSSHELYDKNKEIYNSTLDHTKKYKHVINLISNIKKRQKKKKKK